MLDELERLKAEVASLKREKAELKKKIFELQNQRIRLTAEQQEIISALEENSNNYFVTGRAGTGKSTILNYFRSTTEKNVAVVAPTGAAAINVGGQTIHSFFRMSLGPQDVMNRQNIMVPSYIKTILNTIDILIIDEISMVRSDVMDMIDSKLRDARQVDEPFGGVRIIAFGDLYQLPPVVKTKEERDFILNRYDTLFFFGCKAARDTFEVLEMKEVLRQKDWLFKETLNEIRQGHSIFVETINNECVRPAPKDWIRLTPKRETARQINLQRLTELNSEEKYFETELGGNDPPAEEDVPFDFDLRLKKGCQVMTVINDAAGQYSNGSIGTVKDLSDDTVFVEIDHSVISIGKQKFEKYRYAVDGKGYLEKNTVGWAKQFPLRLAYAITIHKSQGKTYDHVVVDYSGSSAFSPGQTYVALSRCTTMDGLRLTRPLTKEDVYVDPEVTKYLDEKIPSLMGFTCLPGDMY